MSPDHWIALANVVMALAAVAAAIAAFLGLDRWKSQSVWQVDTDLAQRVLMAVYRYRDSLYSIRHPAMSSGEMRVDEEEKNDLPEAQTRKKGVVIAYVNRWQRHQEKRNDLEALLIEADALWGIDLSKLLKPLRELEHELFVYIMLHLDAHYRYDNELAADYRKILKSKRNILYDLLDDEKDDFRKDFIKCLIPIEKYLREKLGHGR